MCRELVGFAPMSVGACTGEGVLVPVAFEVERASDPHVRSWCGASPSEPWSSGSDSESWCEDDGGRCAWGSGVGLVLADSDSASDSMVAVTEDV